MLQWGKVYGRETSYVGLYYMLNKVFVAVDTPQGSFDSSMVAILEKSSEEEAGMYLICLYSGEDLQWPFKVVYQRAISIPLDYHDDASCYEGGWWEYGPCCLLFKSGKPSHFVPLSMMDITVFGSSALQSQMSMVQTPAVASGSR